MSRLQDLRDLRSRVDLEIAREVAYQGRMGRIEAEAATLRRDPYEYAALIMCRCADHYGVPVAALSSTRRTRQARTARQVAAWAIRTSLGMSYPDIGRLLNRDHSTIIHAEKRVQDDAQLRAVGARLLREVVAA